MPKAKRPRFGSMQFWPRKRAKRAFPRVKAWAPSKDVNVLGFAGYKAGMTHIIITDNRQNSLTKGQEIFCPVTVIECPSLKVAGIKFYKSTPYGAKNVTLILAEKLDKELARRIKLPKKLGKKIEDVKEFDDLKLLVYTQPKFTGIGKKIPELFELAIGGKLEDKLAYAKEKLGKDISAIEAVKDGQQVDIHSVTRGKGFQGPVKRFGVGLRNHKSEKTIRGPGSLGAWRGQAHMMYRIAHAGQMGYHTRSEYNKHIIKVSTKIEDVNPKGGFINYGFVKNPYILVKGSVGGAKKRLIRMIGSIRPNKKVKDAPAIVHISTDSKQGK